MRAQAPVLCVGGYVWRLNIPEGCSEEVLMKDAASSCNDQSQSQTLHSRKAGVEYNGFSMDIRDMGRVKSTKR